MSSIVALCVFSVGFRSTPPKTHTTISGNFKFKFKLLFGIRCLSFSHSLCVFYFLCLFFIWQAVNWSPEAGN